MSAEKGTAGRNDSSVKHIKVQKSLLPQGLQLAQYAWRVGAREERGGGVMGYVTEGIGRGQAVGHLECHAMWFRLFSGYWDLVEEFKQESG